jgi:hypothetical protein
MPSAAYFRRQADICLRLSLIASDDHVSNRLITMARDYMAMSEALERESGGASASSEGDLDGFPAGFSETPDLPGSSAES